MKQKIRLVAVLWPLRKLSAISFRLSALGNQLSALFRKYKRKQPNNRRQYDNSFTNKIGGKSLEIVFHVCSTLRSAPHPLRGLAMVFASIGMLWLAPVRAQVASAPDIKPLQIGDTIPEYFWQLPLQVVNHPDGKDTITLNDYRGKLIILDFWGTFCSACISAMPKINVLGRQFAEDMAVIPVSWSKPEPTFQTLQNHEVLSSLGLSSVVEAQQLIDAFPHRVVPFYVWINLRGEVVATTGSNDVSHDNVAKVLQDDEPDYALMTYIDTEKPLLLASEVMPKGAELQHYAVFIRGKMPSIGSKTSYRKTGETIHGLGVFNFKLSSIYSMIVAQIKGDYTSKRITMVDPIDFDGLYTFDFIVPFEQADSLYPHMLAFVNQQSGYCGQWVTRNRQCLVLTRIGNGDSFIANEGKESYSSDNMAIQMGNYPIDQFIRRLNWDDISGSLLVIDDTGYRGPVNITLKPPFDDRKNVQRQLNQQGLDLVVAERDVELFEIRKSRNNLLISRD